MIHSKSGTTSGFKRCTDSGARFRIASKITAVVPPVNAGRPDAISYNTAPNEKRSVRWSSSSPRACSGDMYATVPSATPVLVKRSVSPPMVGPAETPTPSTARRGLGTSLANPKSNTLACPRAVTKMFAGLRSRWIIPNSWAASRPSDTWIAISRV